MRLTRWWRQPAEDQSLARLVAARLQGALLAMLGVAVVATIGYVAIEGYGWIDAVYMTVITLGTIGYGEVRPLDTAGRFLTIGVIISGFAAFVYAASILTSFFTSGEAARHLQERRARRVEAELKDHVIVVGYGRVGQAVVRSLTRMERQCVVLDMNPALRDAIEESGAIHIAGDAANEDDLRRAGIERAVAFVAAADQDSANLVVVLTAHALCPALQIVARVNESTWLTRMERAGANVAQSPYDSYGDSLAVSALSAHAGALRGVHMLGIGLGIGTEEIPLAEGSPLAERHLAQVEETHRGVHILGVRRNDELHRWHDVAGPLRPGDVLFAIGTPEHLSGLARACRQPS